LLHLVGSSILLYLIDDARSNKIQVCFTFVASTKHLCVESRILSQYSCFISESLNEFRFCSGVLSWKEFNRFDFGLQWSRHSLFAGNWIEHIIISRGISLLQYIGRHYFI